MAISDASTARGPRPSGQGGFGQGFLTDIWYFAALSRDLKPGSLKRHEILGEPVLLGRNPNGALVALRDVCPHRAAPLSAGRFVPATSGAFSLECPYHGWRFGSDGRCLAIPSLTDGQEIDLARIRVRRFHTAENQGLVFIWMPEDGRGESAPDQSPPHFPGVVGGAPKLALSMVFAAHIDHAVVGLMDPAHGPFVHRQWWWRSAASMHAKSKRFEPSEAGFTMVRHRPSSNSRAYVLLGGQPETEIAFRLPGLRWELVTVGARHLLSLTCLTPLNASSTRITQVVWSDHPILKLLTPLVRAGAKRFLKQDGDMVNLQNEGLKYNPSLMWIDDADKQAKWYALLKREWSASRRESRAFVNPVEATTLAWTS
jgi:phenylpropionate dioxygenase-like ring-hydroxylating dioxygenase large terminal subunit